jgi:hypothetical protein
MTAEVFIFNIVITNIYKMEHSRLLYNDNFDEQYEFEKRSYSENDISNVEDEQDRNDARMTEDEEEMANIYWKQCMVSGVIIGYLAGLTMVYMAIVSNNYF